MKRLLLLTAAGAMLAFAACNNSTETKEAPASSFNLSAAKDSITASNAAFAKAVNSGDSTGVAALYTSDALLMPANMPVFKGRAGVLTFMGDGIRYGLNSMNLQTTEVFGNEELLTEIGTYTLKFGNVPDTGKYIVVWKKEDGKWKMFRDIFNSDMPPPPHEEPGKK